MEADHMETVRIIAERLRGGASHAEVEPMLRTLPRHLLVELASVVREMLAANRAAGRL